MLEKVCKNCGSGKSLTLFYPKKGGKYGVTGTCKDCILLKNKEWKDKNPDLKKITDRNYYLNNKNKLRAYRSKWAKNNPEIIYLIRKKWRDNNPEKCKSYWTKNSTRRLKSAPWADKDKIKKIYSECRKISRITGIKHHVDHIIPLCGEIVCGLHHQDNLQIVPAILNLKKSNKYGTESERQNCNL